MRILQFIGYLFIGALHLNVFHSMPLKSEPKVFYTFLRTIGQNGLSTINFNNFQSSVVGFKKDELVINLTDDLYEKVMFSAATVFLFQELDRNDDFINFVKIEHKSRDFNTMLKDFLQNCLLANSVSRANDWQVYVVVQVSLALFQAFQYDFKKTHQSKVKESRKQCRLFY